MEIFTHGKGQVVIETRETVGTSSIAIRENPSRAHSWMTVPGRQLGRVVNSHVPNPNVVRKLVTLVVRSTLEFVKSWWQ